MDDEDGDDRGEIERLPEDPPTPMDPAGGIWPSLTNLARHSPSVTALSTMGPRCTEAMPLDDPVHSCGPEHGTSPRDSLPASLPANKLPATLIRTLDGRICAWSHGMESRYGFPASRAIGLTSHQPSPARPWTKSRELLDQQTWSGGLVNYRSDGHPIMTANSWHLHRNFNSEARFVTEVHADIVATGSVVEAHLMIDLPEQAISKMRPGRTPLPSPSAQPDTPRTARASMAVAALLAHARRRTTPVGE